MSAISATPWYRAWRSSSHSEGWKGTSMDNFIRWRELKSGLGFGGYGQMRGVAGSTRRLSRLPWGNGGGGDGGRTQMGNVTDDLVPC